MHAETSAVDLPPTLARETGARGSPSALGRPREAATPAEFGAARRGGTSAGHGAPGAGRVAGANDVSASPRIRGFTVGSRAGVALAAPVVLAGCAAWLRFSIAGRGALYARMVDGASEAASQGQIRGPISASRAAERVVPALRVFLTACAAWLRRSIADYGAPGGWRVEGARASAPHARIVGGAAASPAATLGLLAALSGCHDPVVSDTDPSDPSSDSASDTDATVAPVVYDPWPFLDQLIAYEPGDHAGYGQDRLPDVVFGPPAAPGNGGGSLDVVSLGREGSIIVAFRDLDVVDGPGPDLLVFENAFAGWPETGVVGVSDDGETWTEWPCDAANAAAAFPGCAGVAPVWANAENGVDATDPDAAGGDRFDLATIGVARARFVRVRDSGRNPYDGTSGGFDLDAMAVVNGEAPSQRP
jgi:hypothetical protein